MQYQSNLYIFFTHKSKYIISLFSLLLIFLWLQVYSQALTISPYMDDLTVKTKAMQHGWSYFINSNDGLFFRPIESALLTISYHFTKSHHLALVISWSIFIFSAYLLCRLSKFLFHNSMATYVAFILYLYHSIHTPALSQLDTISQQLVNIFAITGVLLSLSFFQIKKSNTIKYTVYAIIIGSLLASKETSIGLILFFPICIIFSYYRENNNNPFHIKDITKYIKNISILFSISLGLLVLYFLYKAYSLHNLINPSEGRYQIIFHPSNILKNITLFLISVIYMGNNVTLVLTNHINYYTLITSILISILFFMSIVYKIYIIIQKKCINNETMSFIVLILLLLVACMPAIFLHKISDLYSYQLTPYYILLASYSLTTLLSKIPKQYISRMFLSLIIISYLYISYEGIDTKLNLMKKEGEYSQLLLEKAYSQIYSPTEFKKFCRTDPAKLYSIYALSNPNLIHYINRYVRDNTNNHNTIDYSCK